ncbi:hypothetical protein [Kitasatospora aureofaciens]|uniref:hypothetical protein n=1 Tax=Kitasatospora aureofaciens TaxID=1894 RepID=UPI001C44F3B8|nr:hypothetical protein [Kitasatospora aureofaciens]MBV6703089.1 hypothetical protein [Kitasatospora aureofaciens]
MADGPGYHLAVLRESQDFWDPSGPGEIAAAYKEFAQPHARRSPRAYSCAP